MSTPKVTILMPVWNAEKLISESLASIWAQTFSDFELLVVDDGSTDRTPEILAECRDPRLCVVRNDTRRRLPGALNRGLDEARGEFIARMDADDRMRAERLALQVAHLEKFPEIACCGSWARSFGKGKAQILKYPSGAEAIKAFALFYSPFAHPSVMFRRELFAQEDLCYDGSFSTTQDYELWSRVIQKFPCDNLPRVLLDYRVHPASTTGVRWAEMDVKTMVVQRRVLGWLGIEPCEWTLRLHRAASMGELPAEPESFFHTESWLLKLQEANQIRGIFEPAALDDMLNYVWFRMSMAVVRKMGDEAWKLFCKSSLASMGEHAGVHRRTMRFAALKARFLGRHS